MYNRGVAPLTLGFHMIAKIAKKKQFSDGCDMETTTNRMQRLLSSWISVPSGCTDHMENHFPEIKVIVTKISMYQTAPHRV